MTNWAKSGKNWWQSDSSPLGFYRLWSGFICANSQGCKSLESFRHGHWDKAIQQRKQTFNVKTNLEPIQWGCVAQYIWILVSWTPTNRFHFWRLSSVRASQRSVSVNEGALFLHLVQALEATSLDSFWILGNPKGTNKHLQIEYISLGLTCINSPNCPSQMANLFTTSASSVGPWICPEVEAVVRSIRKDW